MTTTTSDVQIKKGYHHGDLRGQLLAAVRELVEENGPDGFSISQACKRAGVSTAAPYKHFKDRHEILRGVVLLAMDRLIAAMQAAADSCAPGEPGRIAAIGRAYIDFARAEPGLFRTMFGLTESHSEDQELTHAGAVANGIVEQVVADHLDLAPTDPQVKLRAYALWCFVHGHSFLQMDSKHVEGLTRAEENAMLGFVGEAMMSRNAA